MANPLVTATGDQFIETFEPAQATATVEFDERRVDHVLDRRIPAHPHVAHRSLQHIHATGRHDRQLHRAVIDIDNADALLTTAMQGTQGHGKRFGGFYAELLTGDRPVFCRSAGVEQDIVPSHGMRSGRECAEGDEEFERGHGSSLYWSCAIFIALRKRFSKSKEAVGEKHSRAGSLPQGHRAFTIFVNYADYCGASLLAIAVSKMHQRKRSTSERRSAASFSSSFAVTARFDTTSRCSLLAKAMLCKLLLSNVAVLLCS